MSAAPPASQPAPVQWEAVGTYRDIRFLRSEEGIARISINRPEKRNAFRPGTVQELCDALSRVRDDPGIGVVLFSAEGPSAKDGGWAFCSGGDQRARKPCQRGGEVPRSSISQFFDEFHFVG